MSDQELKLAVAKMLPKKIAVRGHYAYNQTTGEHDFVRNHFHWGSNSGNEILDTEQTRARH